MTITECLMINRDSENAKFQAKLTPNLPQNVFLGIKTPVIRKIGKQFGKSEEAEKFLKILPHEYYDENMLHGIMISEMKDYGRVIEELDRFLPYVDNWGVCDSIKPKIFTKNKDALLEKIKEWTNSGKTYTCRFGIEMLMTFYLDGDFLPEYLAIPAGVKSDEYYVNMMIAWFFATALAKQWNSAVIYLEEKKLPVWAHNKTVQKACESFRITAEQKEYLKSLKR